MANSQDTDPKTSTEPTKPGFAAIVLSTLAAAFGVQTDKNRQRDFQQGNIYSFIAAGIIFTGLFVLATVLLVQLVL